MNAISHAHRGLALEEVVDLSNNVYRGQQKAVIHKVPSAWLPIRNHTGKIVSAKIDKKSSVDFLGHFGGIPIAFDAKEVSKGKKWYLRRLEAHQYEYLRDSTLTGAVCFVLLGFWQVNEFYIFPFTELEQRWDAWKDGGPASITAGEDCLIKVEFPDYLKFLKGTKGGGCGIARTQKRSKP